jgi:hypothetical protein
MSASTHGVFNQPQPLVDYHLFESNSALRSALRLNAPQLEEGAGSIMVLDLLRATRKAAAGAALLYQRAPAPVFDPFCASRLGCDWGQVFGTLPPGSDFDAIIARAMPR